MLILITMHLLPETALHQNLDTSDGGPISQRVLTSPAIHIVWHEIYDTSPGEPVVPEDIHQPSCQTQCFTEIRNVLHLVAYP